MSAPVISVAAALDKDLESGKRELNRSGSGSITDAQVSWMQLKWGHICQLIDGRELVAFMMWEVLVVLTVVLAVTDWICFFKFVVEPEDPKTRVKWGALWGIGTVLFLYFRHSVRSRCGEDVRSLADHAEIFVTMSLIMVCGTNVAFYLHTPSSTPLRDLGFMLIPEQSVDSKWRPVSDILTAVMPVIFMFHSYFMSRANRCKVMSTFFRVATICYGLRMCTIALTSLPGPAPHCRPGSANYFPPKNWIDIVTRVGPMYGNYNSCGDLIFSGHMAYTNSALLLYLRVLDRYEKRYSRLRWVLGAMYLLTLATLCIAGRKHYTVDVVLGIITSTMVFFHFEHGWVPLCMQVTPEMLHQHHHAKRSLYPYSSKDIVLYEDDEDLRSCSDSDEDARDDVDDASNVSLVSNRKGAKLNRVEFAC